MIAARLAAAAIVTLLFAATAGAEPANLGDLKTKITAYHDSGAYDRELARVDAKAIAYIDKSGKHVAHAALVLDIDETSLSNWPEIKADDYGYIGDGPCDALPKGPCGAKAWEMSARAPAIAPTLELFRHAKKDGVAVFFITGRDESERDATATNLTNAGYKDWDGLILRPVGSHTPSAADYKAPARASLEAKGFHIVANVGDQKSDLAGGHSDKTFKLPNPFYFIK